MDFNASFHLDSINDIIENHHLEEGGKVQEFFTNEVWRLSDDYIPYREGFLKDNVIVTPTKIIYNSIYAQYQWHGLLMVDPIYLKGAFFNPDFGYWSRPGVPKVMDPEGRAINNWNGLRGPYWTPRMWSDRGAEIENAVQKYLDRGAK